MCAKLQKLNTNRESQLRQQRRIKVARTQKSNYRQYDQITPQDRFRLKKLLQSLSERIHIHPSELFAVILDVVLQDNLAKHVSREYKIDMHSCKFKVS